MNAKAIGKKLKLLRNGKSKIEVCNDLGISVSALSMYEIGQRVPRDEIKIKLANYYGESIENIFFEEKYTFSEHSENKNPRAG